MIINLGDPTDPTDAINKQYLEKSHVKPSHYNNEFKYLMTNKLAWTDLEPNNTDSFDITKIDNLMPQDGNYDQYNHKVLYTKKELYKYYHYRYWCYQKAYTHYKKVTLASNIVWAGLVIIGSVAGGITANPIIIGTVTGAGVLLKTFCETKNYKREI